MHQNKGENGQTRIDPIWNKKVWLLLQCQKLSAIMGLLVGDNEEVVPIHY
mgnify:CR=1 FL=1